MERVCLILSSNGVVWVTDFDGFNLHVADAVAFREVFQHQACFCAHSDMITMVGKSLVQPTCCIANILHNASGVVTCDKIDDILC